MSGQVSYFVELAPGAILTQIAPAGSKRIHARFIGSLAVVDGASAKDCRVPSSEIHVDVVNDTYVTIRNTSGLRVYGDLVVERHDRDRDLIELASPPTVVGKAFKRVDAVEAWAREQVAAIEADERYRQPPALVQVNAPLALIQVEMKARVQALTEVLERLKP